MAGLRKSVAMQNQIYELFDKGHKLRAIARILKIGRNTVRRVLKLRESSSEANPASLAPQDSSALNWPEIVQERARGICLKVLHAEHAPSDWDYHKFWREFKKHAPKEPANITMRIDHKPAEKTFFDFANGIDIVNLKTGEVTQTQFFCAVLPFSSLTYGEFVANQQQPTFCGAIENAFAFFGGTTNYVTIDNLKAGVAKAHVYDPDVNPVFCAFANHWNFAVLPARPFKPRDKAANESAIGVIQKSFFQEVRNKTFHSLFELNQAFRSFLVKLNSQTMKEYEVSRMERFQNEKHLLKPLPKESFEFFTQKKSKVHADCHIQLQNKFYSVPYKFVGQEVLVKISSKLVQIFTADNELIATHLKISEHQRCSTNPDHYPEHKTAITRFEVQTAISQAQMIGPHTHKLVQYLVTTDWPLKHLRRVQGILRLVQSKLVSIEALEYASQQAFNFKKLNYQYVKNAALFFKNGGTNLSLGPPQRSQTEMFLHSIQNKTAIH